MPTATRRREPAAPLTKRRPSATARSESGYSRRSSLGSFKTATGASEHAPEGVFASEDSEIDAQDASDNEATITHSRSDQNFTQDDADDTETVSHLQESPKGLVAAESQEHEDASSNESEGSPAIFNQNPSSDSSTVHKSPPTSQDDAASHDHDNTGTDQHSSLQIYNPKSRSSRHELLTPDTALTPQNRNDRKGVRASHASHLTLPYQQSEAGDFLDASRRLSKMTMSSYNPRSRAPSRAASFINADLPDMEMRDARYRSVSERGGSKSSRLMAPAPVIDFGGSVRGSYQSQRGPGSRYASSLMGFSTLRSPTKRDTLGSPSAGIHQRDSDRLSITSRGTARKAGSVMSKMLDADTQVYPGTRIRKYIEPQLNEAMRRVMKQFSGHHMQDHRCNGYPIAVFVGATAIDTGSIIQPHVSGAVSLYFGPGHPKNMASLLPEEDRTPAHIPNPKAPTPASLSRRAELRAAITALHTIYELYRGRACAHVCIDSAYVAKAWGTWIPAWELKGWPGEDDEREGDRERWEEEYYERRRNQRRVYDRHGSRYMYIPERRDRERSRDGYASDGGRYRSRNSRAPPSPRRYDPRDDWLASDPYADRNRRRGAGTPLQSPRRRGGRSYYDYSSEEDEYYPSRGGRRRPAYDDRYEDDYYRYSPDRSPPRRRPMRRAPGRRLVDEDLLRELADIRYEFARVERDRQGSAHLYLIDRSNNPADRMARAVAKSEGSLLNQREADDFDTQSELGLHNDDAPLSEDDVVLDEEEDEWLETRSRFSSVSKSTKGRAGRASSRNSTRGSIISNATGRLRTSASLPSGHLRGQPRRQLDTFAEEDEDDLEDARSVKSFRTQRSRKSTRAERERDEYLARQERLDDEVRRLLSSKRSASRASHLAPPFAVASEREVRRSMDSRSGTALLSPDRASIDERRRVSNARSQPDIRRANNADTGRSSVRNALASAAAFNGEDESEEDEYGPHSSMQMRSSTRRIPRNRMMSEQHQAYPEMDDLVPPAPVWDSGSVHSRNSIDSRRGPASPGSPRKGLFGSKSRARQQQPPMSPASSRKAGFGLFSNRSTPSLHRSPAPEDPDFEWNRKKNKGSKPHQREWHSTTARDYGHERGERSQWDADDSVTGGKKSGFFGRMFGKKK